MDYYTGWNMNDDFTATQILREIKFWQIQTVKKCYFDNLATLNFEFWSILDLKVAQIY